MSKRKKDPLLEALKAGRSYTWTVPDGGDLASMRVAIKHGQTLTMSPIADPSEIRVGDLVLVKWHQGDIFHIVGEIQGDRFLIVNSLGKVNGWVGAAEILGRITEIIEPEARPGVPAMLDELKLAYEKLIQLDPSADPVDTQRLFSVVDDLRWYAERIGAQRWNRVPQSNKWSFEQNLWRLTKHARQVFTPERNQMNFFIDAGKQCVGLASEILMLFERMETKSRDVDH